MKFETAEELLTFLTDNIKTSYKMIDGKISDGLFKLYDEDGYVEKLEFFRNYKSLD